MRPPLTGVSEALCFRVSVCECVRLSVRARVLYSMKDFDQILYKYSMPRTDKLTAF